MSYLICRVGLCRAACLLALAFPAWAQQPLSIDEAQKIALSRSQQLASRDAAIAAAKESGIAAGQLPDPVLKIGIENVPVSGPDRLSLSRDFMTMRRIGLMQELTRVDKRRLRVERLDRDVARISAERLEAASNILRDTALAWIDRHYAQLRVDLIRRQLKEVQLEVQGAEIAYRSGRGSQAEFFGSRSALITLQDKLRQTERQAQSATAMLARWVGAEEASRPLAGTVNWRESSAAVAHSTQLSHLPNLRVLAAQIEVAETEVQMAQANTRPDVTVEAMYSQRGAAYPDMFSIGISVPLQLNRGRRQDREAAAKAASLAEARANYEEALRTHEAELRVLANDWEAGKERVGLLTEQLLPAAQLRTKAALTAYQTAKGDLMAVLAARREEVEAQIQVLSLEQETARLWAQLNFLIPNPIAVAMQKDRP